MRFDLGLLSLSTRVGEGMRPVLLILLVVAIVLILVGCGIAILTLKNQRKEEVAFITVENPDSGTETP